MGTSERCRSGYAVITGASAGLGREFAWQLAEEGFSLVLAARRVERLDQLKSDILGFYPQLDIKVIPVDLSKELECFRLLEEIKDLRVTIFINNAGFGDCSPFAEANLGKNMQMVDVNVKAVQILTHEMVRCFRMQNCGYLLNVASSAGLLPAGPYMASYYASKAFVASLTRSVARELKEEGSRVYVGALCPGPVDTEFNDVAEVSFGLPGITAEKCVACAIRGMKARKTVIIPTLLMKAANFGSRLLPSEFTIAVTGRQQKKKLGL